MKERAVETRRRFTLSKVLMIIFGVTCWIYCIYKMDM